MEFAAAHDLKTLLKLASLLAANKQSARAERVLRHAIQTAPDDFRAYFNLATILLKSDTPPSSSSCSHEGSRRDEALELYSRAHALDASILEVYGTIAGLLIKMHRPQEAAEWCLRGLRAPFESIGSSDESARSSCFFNLNIALRQTGQMERAIALTWAAIESSLDQESSQILSTWRRRSDTLPSSSETQHVTFVCVKWGSKYGPEYVNTLLSMLKRHAFDCACGGRQFECQGRCKAAVRLVCLTDDPAGVDAGVECRLFPEAPNSTTSSSSSSSSSSSRWRGWWLKAFLFSPLCPGGPVCYLDLDSVILGRLSWLPTAIKACRERNCLVTLSAGGLRSEGRQQGLNSSLLLWINNDDENAEKDGEPASSRWRWGALFSFLDRQYDIITRHIYKFDHYLEMMLGTQHSQEGGVGGEGGGGLLCCYLDTLAPSAVADYTHMASLAPASRAELLDSQKVSLVCFPLQPKPKEACGIEGQEWVEQNWK